MQPVGQRVRHGGHGVGDGAVRGDPSGAGHQVEPVAAVPVPARRPGEHDALRGTALDVGHPRHDVAQLRAEQGGDGVGQAVQDDRRRVVQAASELAAQQVGTVRGLPLRGATGEELAILGGEDDRGRDHALLAEHDHPDTARAGDRGGEEGGPEVDPEAVRHVTSPARDRTQTSRAATEEERSPRHDRAERDTAAGGTAATSRSRRLPVRGDGPRPPAGHRDDVPGPQLRAPAHLDPAVDLHLPRLQQLLGVRAVLGQAGELQELPDPDRDVGEGYVEDRGPGHGSMMRGPARRAPRPPRRGSCAAQPPSSTALDGSALTPLPALVVNFRSFSTGCADPTTCGVEVSDTVLQQGQGMHGSFSRADTRNAMGAMGPSFRTARESAVPASNADFGRTIARILDLTIPAKGTLVGRVLTEALANGATPNAEAHVLRSEPDATGQVTILRYQTVDGTRYFDAAGYPGRTLGLSEATQAAAEPR